MFNFLTGNFRLYAILATVLAVLAAFWYVSGLRGDLAESEANNQRLKNALAVQQQTIEQLKQDATQIKAANDRLTAAVRAQSQDLDTLKRRFQTDKQGNERNFGKSAVKNPEAIERAINRGSKNAARCLEIASGAALTEEEKNAKRKSDINQECPSLANPNYRPSNN